MRSNSAAGFTMIEMIITMTIFAILVAVGIPTMRTWVNNTRVRAVTDSLQTGLRLAQAESLRRSRQVVFALTNSTTPNTTLPLPAVANGKGWAIYTIPSMTAGENPAFIQSGVLASVTSNVTITGTPAVCFNSVGRLVNNSSAGLTAITGAGVNCAQPPNGTPPAWTYGINAGGADRPLQVTLGLGGQVHMCDPSLTRSTNNPEGC